MAWCDFNDDGHIDLYVANDTGPNYLYRNNGNGTFTEVGLMSGAALSEDGKAQASMGVAIGRLRSSRAVEHLRHQLLGRVQRSLSAGQGFSLHGRIVRLADGPTRACPYVGWGCGFFDYDNDGWLDLMLVNGHVYPQLAAAAENRYAQRKLFYRNNRNGTFAEIGSRGRAGDE